MMFLLSWISCSLNTTEQQPCQSSEVCKNLFGFGYHCDDQNDGFCSEIEPNDRCFLSFPSDMYSLEMGAEFRDNVVVDWSAYGNNKIVGVLFDHDSNQPRIDATNLAAKTVRDNFGEDFILVHCDYKNDDYNEVDGLQEEEAVKKVTQYLSEDLGVPVIIGPSGSSDVEAAYQITSQTDTILLSPSATSSSLTDLEGIWRTVGSDDVQGRILANVVLENIVTQELDNEIHIVYENSSYGQNFYITMKDIFDNSSIPLDIKTHSYEIMDDEFVTEFRDSGAGGSSIVFIDADVEDVRFFIGDIFRDGSFAHSKYYLTDSASKEDFLDEIKSSSAELYQSIYGTRPQTIPSAEFENFASNYKNFSEFEVANDAYVPYTYDAAWLAFISYASVEDSETRKAYTITGSDLTEKIRLLSDTTIELERSMDIDWLAIQGQLSQGNSVNIKGVTGHLDFDPLTDEVITDVEVWRVFDNDGGTPCDVVQRTCPSSNLENLESCENNFEEEEYGLQICD